MNFCALSQAGVFPCLPLYHCKHIQEHGYDSIECRKMELGNSPSCTYELNPLLYYYEKVPNNKCCLFALAIYSSMSVVYRHCQI